MTMFLALLGFKSCYHSPEI